MSFFDDSEGPAKLPDIILVNSKLPEMTGFEFSGWVRSNSQYPGIPIILLTAGGRPGDSKLCKDIGINGYLSKPVRREELRLAVETVLRQDAAFVKEKEALITKHTIAEQVAKNKRILLVEDYPTNQQIALRHLKNAGYNAELAENGRIAVRLFKEKQFDLILMDIQMPESGYG